MNPRNFRSAAAAITAAATAREPFGRRAPFTFDDAGL